MSALLKPTSTLETCRWLNSPPREMTGELVQIYQSCQEAALDLFTWGVSDAEIRTRLNAEHLAVSIPWDGLGDVVSNAIDDASYVWQTSFELNLMWFCSMIGDC